MDTSQTSASTTKRSTTDTPDTAVTWIFGHALPPDSPGVETFEAIFDDIRDRTSGLFNVEMASVADHGFDQSDGLRLLADKKLFDLILHFPPYVARDEPLFEAAVVPLHGLVDASDNARVIDVQREIAAEIADAWGLAFASFLHVSGAEKRVYIFSKQPFRSLSDLKKLKIRHWSQLGVETFEAVGIQAKAIPASELYAALENRTVDAAAFPVNYAKAASLDEVATYVTYVTPFIASTPTGLLTRKETWAALPDAFKTVWQDVLNHHVHEEIESYDADMIEPKLLQELEARGMVVQDPLPETDRRDLQTAALRKWKEHTEKLGPKAVGYYQRIVAELAVSPA